MIQVWMFFFASVFAVLVDKGMKDPLQSLLCFALFAVGVIGVFVSLLIWAVTVLVGAVRN